MTPDHPLLERLRPLHRRIRDAVVESTSRAASETLARVDADEGAGDTIYAIDRVAEDEIVAEIDRAIARESPVRLVAEGLPDGQIVLPHGVSPDRVEWVIVMDPIDGTRGLMYQKRPGWILTGVARVGPDGPFKARLRDIELALQTEIPLVKQHLCDELWAVRGQGAAAQRLDRLTGTSRPLPLTPSRARDVRHGFATVARFFPGGRATLAAIDDEIAEALLGPPRAGKALLFEDQYISTGGQLYELMTGRDRFIADLRPLVAGRHGAAAGLACHPYDLCTELIARECGAIVTDAAGAPLDAPLDVSADVAWVGYANAAIRTLVEPVLRAALERHGIAP